MHRVRQIGPHDIWVVHLLAKNLVGLVAHVPRDIVGLSRAAGGMHENLAVRLGNIWCIQGTGEELVVGPVDGVAALEGDNIAMGGQRGADLIRSLAREITHGVFDADDRATNVVVTTFHSDHLDARMLQRGGSVAKFRLLCLVRCPATFNFEHSHRLAIIQQTNLLAYGDKYMYKQIQRATHLGWLI